MSCSALIFDIEIERGIATKEEDKLPGFKYVSGEGQECWRKFDEMGIAVLGVWDCLKERPLVFFKEDLTDFFTLVEQRDLIVGFNSIRFDWTLVKTFCLINDIKFTLANKPHYDILLEGYAAAGLDVNGKFTAAHRGFRLENFSQANFKTGKTLDGASAPIEWQKGNKAKVISYCLDDCCLERDLFYKILSDGFLKHPSGDGRMLRFRKPLEEITGTLSPSGGTGNSSFSSKPSQLMGNERLLFRARNSGLVEEIQQPLFEGVPEKVVGYHKEVKPEGAPKSDDDAT